jgi:hypothetical protein
VACAGIGNQKVAEHCLVQGSCEAYG